MKFLTILQVYLKRTFRDKMFILIMIVFPIALIWILGNAFTGMMGDTGSSTMHANMLYEIKDTSTSSNDFKTYMIDAKSETFTFALEKDYDKAIEQLKKNNYDAYVVVSKDTIKIYKNSVYNFNGTMAEMIISAYTDKYNIISEIINVDPKLMQNIGKESNNTFTKTIPLDKRRQPSSMDYYGVTITSMFIFYGLIFISTYIIGEKRQKTRDRILIAPVKNASYQWGVITGNVIILFLQMCLLILLGIFVFNTYWGDNIIVPILVLTFELIMISSIGALLGILIESEAVVAGVAQLVIPILVFLGDGYVQLPNAGVFGIVKKISPVYWVNHSIFSAIYLNDYKNAYISIAINLSIALLSTLIIVFYKKKWRTKNV